MSTGQRRSALSYIPGLKDNAVLKLIIFTASAYMMLALSWAVIMIVYVGNGEVFNTYFLSNISLTSVHQFSTHWWTVLTYGWFQQPNSFMELLSSMLWLYCFGSVVQMLVGGRQIAPLFTYALIAGGLFYMLAQLLPGKAGMVMPAFLGARAGIMAMAIAAITLTPHYRFYLTETFSVPLMGVVIVFSALMIYGSGFNIPILALLLAGGAAGFAYVRLLKAGYRLGEWPYKLIDKLESTVTPSEQPKVKRKGNTISMYQPRKGISQYTIDDILDKINQKGYNSLSREEKDILLRAGKE